MLLGRREEQARVECLLDMTCRGHSAVLVVRGEPGIGKTSLLRYATSVSEEMSVVWGTGIPAEAELEYSCLHELVRPLLHHLEQVTDYQAASLREALGLAPPRHRDRLTVGAALLGLLAAAAEERPLLVVMDDVQWVDHASADALRFAARRLLVDRVALLIGLREGESNAFDGAGFDELRLGGLDVEDVAALLEARGTTVPRNAVERIHRAAAGNPLAVIEVADIVTREKMAHRLDEPAPMPAGPAIQRAFARRAADLPEATRRALLVTAVSVAVDIETIGRAMANLGLDLDVLELAEDAGLVSIDAGVIAFRHPLVRSAIYHSATGSERRSAHRALADAMVGGDEDRRGWHLAGAALGPDESVAGALAAVAARSRMRGGHAAAAAALEHAARLTPDALTRLDRLAAAADAAWWSGATTAAIALVEEALARCDDPIRRGRFLSLRGRIEYEVGVASVACDMQLEAARLIEPHDPAEAASALLHAMLAILESSDLSRALAVAEWARTLAPRDGGMLDARAGIALGATLFRAGRGAEGLEPLEAAVRTLAGAASSEALIRAAVALDLLERGPESNELVRRGTERAREDGPAALAWPLVQEARIHFNFGDWRRAVASGEEGLALGQEFGDVPDKASALVLLARVDAAQGHEQRCRERIDAAVGIATSHEMKIVSLQAHAAVGLLELGLGRLDSAAEALRRVARTTEQCGLFAREITTEPDLVEALLGLGRVCEAHEWLDAYASRVVRAGSRWGAALVARGRGMLADGDDEAEHHLEEALEIHRVVPDGFQEARTLLCSGQRLRRAGRKSAARERLRQAFAGFEALGAAPWAARARAELRATGETIRRARHQAGEELTPQELQVALQVAEGKTNKEAAAALFLSPRTIEFHLARVYPKLGVGSRAELIKRMNVSEPRTLQPA